MAAPITGRIMLNSCPSRGGTSAAVAAGNPYHLAGVAGRLEFDSTGFQKVLEHGDNRPSHPRHGRESVEQLIQWAARLL